MICHLKLWGWWGKGSGYTHEIKVVYKSLIGTLNWLIQGEQRWLFDCQQGKELGGIEEDWEVESGILETLKWKRVELSIAQLSRGSSGLEAPVLSRAGHGGLHAETTTFSGHVSCVRVSCFCHCLYHPIPYIHRTLSHSKFRNHLRHQGCWNALDKSRTNFLKRIIKSSWGFSNEAECTCHTACGEENKLLQTAQYYRAANKVAAEPLLNTDGSLSILVSHVCGDEYVYLGTWLCTDCVVSLRSCSLYMEYKMTDAPPTPTHTHTETSPNSSQTNKRAGWCLQAPLLENTLMPSKFCPTHF